MGHDETTTTPGGSSGASGVESNADNVYYDADNRQNDAQNGVKVGAWGRIVRTAIDPGVRGVERRAPDGGQVSQVWWSSVLRVWCWVVYRPLGRTYAHGEGRSETEARTMADLHARRLYELQEVSAGGAS